MEKEVPVIDNIKNSVVICPECHCNKMEPTRVWIYNRKNNRVAGQRIEITEGQFSGDNDNSANPSPTKGGAIIFLICQRCNKKTLLITYYHKQEFNIRMKVIKQ